MTFTDDEKSKEDEELDEFELPNADEWEKLHYPYELVIFKQAVKLGISPDDAEILAISLSENTPENFEMDGKIF